MQYRTYTYGDTIWFYSTHSPGAGRNPISWTASGLLKVALPKSHRSFIFSVNSSTILARINFYGFLLYSVPLSGVLRNRGFRAPIRSLAFCFAPNYVLVGVLWSHCASLIHSRSFRRWVLHFYWTGVWGIVVAIVVVLELFENLYLI